MSRSSVAIISNSLTPYRLHFHRRLVRELTGVEWWSLFTHDVSNAPWELPDVAEIRPVRFGIGERADNQSKFSNVIHEHRKGGRIVRWLIEHDVKAVILLGYNDPCRLRVLRWCHQRRLPCFVFGDSNIRGDVGHGVKAWLKLLILPRILRRASGALPCGSLGREYFRKYGVPDERIFEMPYEPDYGMIQSISDDTVAAEFHSRGLPQDRNYLLFCGRLVPVKRVDLLISAFAAISADRLNWDLILLGDGPLRRDLMAQVPSEIAARVHWLGFVDDQRVIATIQRGAQVSVLPSDFEPWGVVINEAAAAGMAIVASDVVGAAADLVRDEINGRIFPHGDEFALIRALLDVTHPVRLGDYRLESAAVLDDWRRRADPVLGAARALASVGIHAQ